MHYSKCLFDKGLLVNRKMITQSQLSTMQFIAKLDNPKHFYNSIKAINFNETGIFVFNQNGLKVIVEESKYVQATLYMTRECFSEYNFNGCGDGDDIMIGINLTMFTECLSIFSGVEFSMKMIYKGKGAPLVLVLIQNDVDDLITECSIKTKNHQQPLDYTIDEQHSAYNRIILRGPDVSNVFNEINKNANNLEICLSPIEPHIRFITLGVQQSETTVDIAKTSDMITMFSCNTKYRQTFRLANVRLAMRAIALAVKIAIRTDHSGLLSLHMMILNEGNSTICIEYFITPLIDNDDDNNNNNNNNN